MKRRTRIAATVAAALLTLACAPERADRPAGAAGGAEAREPAPVTPAPVDSVRLRLDLPASVRVGQAVPIQLRIENTSARAVDLYLMGRPIAFDVIVSREDRVVWRRLEGQVVAAILQIRTLAPGEALELRAEWDQRDHAGRAVAPGAYQVAAEVKTDGEPLRAGPVELRILRKR
ncbi:MAG: hypothetical protein HY703_08915 [Gemmatimonadetes bacterium]|nr:hypothetical protein [Gemmatimonadota bacterium]